MAILVGVALGWLGIGSLIAGVVLTDHLRTGSGFPGMSDWWLIPAVAIVWPWPVWVWYSSRHTPIPQTARVGLLTIVLTGGLGSGWVFGLTLYDSIYPKELKPPDTPGLNVMIQGILNSEVTGNTGTNNEESQIGTAPPSR